jgi:hypothetical protein
MHAYTGTDAAWMHGPVQDHQMRAYVKLVFKTADTEADLCEAFTVECINACRNIINNLTEFKEWGCLQHTYNNDASDFTETVGQLRNVSQMLEVSLDRYRAPLLQNQNIQDQNQYIQNQNQNVEDQNIQNQNQNI